ncbi:HEAT repeat domain-containing protein [Candidatus Thorarchaeota archaeon]|nr:HEAT repeat domain-containing protein [Candidatus Thorarchaeota archaeon]TFG95732.1 MAG: HEAT repeat domain-containing protein [Candidatus Thorarchaeota archaeon]
MTTGDQEAAVMKELEIDMHSDDEQVSLGTIGRLGHMKDPKATEVLVLGLKDPRHMVRIHVAAQLGERKDKKAVDALIESLQDESIFVRQTVAGALENIGGTKAKKAVANAEKEGVLLDNLPEGRRLDN